MNDNEVTSNTIWLSVSVASGIAFLLIWILKGPSKTKNHLGIPYAPYTFWEIVQAAKGLRFHKLLLDSSRQVGLVFSLRGQRGLIAVGDITIARDVLQDRHAKKIKGYDMFHFIHGQKNDILTSDNLFWLHSRKGTAPAFSLNHIKRMTDVSLKHVQKFASERLQQLSKTHEDMDIGKEMVSLTFDIICEAAFQYEMSPEEKETFLCEMEIALKECYASDVPLRRKLGRWIPSVQRAVLARQRIISIAQNIMNSYRTLDNPIKGTVIDCIMNNNKAYESDIDRIADVLILVLAGHETTAFSLAWTLLELAKHPTIQNELRQSIQKQQPVTSPMEYKENIYLQHVIHESMRLHPVASSGSARISNKDYTYQIDEHNKVTIPKGTDLLFSPIVYFRSEQYFDNPNEFVPSRWNNDDTSNAQKQNDAFFPFSLGRRNCIGQPLAISELYTIIPYLIINYNFILNNEGTEEFFLTLKPKNVRLNVEKVIK